VICDLLLVLLSLQFKV